MALLPESCLSGLISDEQQKEQLEFLKMFRPNCGKRLFAQRYVGNLPINRNSRRSANRAYELSSSSLAVALLD